MRNTSRLILGELHRLVIYKILPISLLVAIFWVIILLFVSKEDALNVAPLPACDPRTSVLAILCASSLYNMMNCAVVEHSERNASN
jgi:hypothetical protein